MPSPTLPTAATIAHPPRESRRVTRPRLRSGFRVRHAQLHFLPLETRMPLKFGHETVTSLTCARVGLTLEDARGRRATGWGETPLSVTWVWPGTLTYGERYEALLDFCRALTGHWASNDARGQALEIGHAFQQQELRTLWQETNSARGDREPMPWLAALVCCSAFDLALHDAAGLLLDRPVYATYGADLLRRDLARYLRPARGAAVSFKDLRPDAFLRSQPEESLPAWHLVGGKDPIDSAELTGAEPNDGYPVLLRDWIRRDGLTCLKIKLRGNDPVWDLDRIRRVGRIGIEEGVRWLSTDFNCTVTDPAYVNEILDTLLADDPRLYGMILYVEQPFPYDLEEHQIDVHSVSARKPLFMDESCHDWELIRLGRELGWTGVALKTCKTQTGALLSLCWAKAHGMTLMVQDLTNPMLAQIPHCLLAAHAGTIMGVETNAMQFYPDASGPEERVHPGLFRRRSGCVNLGSLRGPGFGYRIREIERTLPPPAAEVGDRA